MIIYYIVIYLLISFFIGYLVSRSKIYFDVCKEENRNPGKNRLPFILRTPIVIPYIICRIPMLASRVIKRLKEGRSNV